VSGELPSAVSDTLEGEEKLISYLPEPDLRTRRRIIFALFPTFVCVALIGHYAFTDRRDVLLGFATVYLMVALFIFAIRRCRTSYIISTRRLIHLVSGQNVGAVVLAEAGQPFLLDYAERGFTARWVARFLLLGPTVNVMRIKPKPWTISHFFNNRDRLGIQIGYPGHSLAIAKIFEDVTLAWASAQDMPKATP
jgi:hypothetical protein